MNCRYCGNVYANDDRTCGGCGAPKHALRQTLLDAPATPEHWSNSLTATVMRVLMVTLGVLVLMGLATALGIGGFASVLAFFWILPVAPVLMTYAAWRSAKGQFGAFFLRLFAVFGVWNGVFFAVFLAIGVVAAASK